MTHSALSIRSCGMSSGISMTSLTTMPQFSRRAASFLSICADSGRAISARAVRQDIIRFITLSPLLSFLGNNIIECPWVRCNYRAWWKGPEFGGGCSFGKTCGGWIALPFDYTFAGRSSSEPQMKIEKIAARRLAVMLVSLMVVFGSGTSRLHAQSKSGTNAGHGAAKKPSAAARKATAKFAARAETLLGSAPASKGEWGLLIVDAESGETLFEQNADRYFLPASNMKLFSTALALAKLGPDFRFRTTLETRGTISDEGILAGDVVLVGRGDPNLSNRRFPYELKEEFDGPPEKALAQLADALVAKGVKEISGDVVGDDSYFPRERYPNGWEIDDMVWEYGAAISAIVVDDNTVTVTLTA